MKKLNLFCITFCIVLLLTACSSVGVSKPDVNIDNVPWEAKMGINYLDDRALMVEYENNTEYTITELELKFKMKDKIKEDKLVSFYSYLKEEYNLSEEDAADVRKTGVSMNSHAYFFDKDEYLKKGDKIEEPLTYGIKFIRNMDYFDLFEPEMYKIKYIDELGEEHVTYYDYLNKTYTEK